MHKGPVRFDLRTLRVILGASVPRCTQTLHVARIVTSERAHVIA